MLETVSQGFKTATERLRGIRELSDENIADSLADVRRSLLEADVDFQVAKDFLERVKQRALGEKVKTYARERGGRKLKVSTGQHFVGICKEELVNLMGPVETELARKDGAISIMLVGLQGVGKTTIAAKLAKYLKNQGRKPLLVAADIYRPAAVDQLKTLGESIEIPVHTGSVGQLPAEICREAKERARRDGRNAIIYDTAGRLAADEDLMNELQQIDAAVAPANTLLVCDALMGRDAVSHAEAFSAKLQIDGICMTKLDGDARGGAALSVKAVTGISIKFLGTGETLDRLEEFRPEGLASRILGMGDIVGLVKDFEEVVDEKQAEEDAERILKGQFTLEDLISQLQTLQKMGPVKEIFARMPGMGGMAEQVDEGELVKVKAMVGSMTPGERQVPSLINKSRTTRIAAGSGRKPKEVTDLLKRFEQMKGMMAMLGQQSGLMGKLTGGMPGMGGGMPSLPGVGGMPGFDPMAMLGGGASPIGRTKRRTSTADRKKKQKQAKKSRRKGRKK
ncbi:MAG: signal recognition particle protein [Myxococcales bacterium]|nr:signal recognition particle protein [Myxococcales bacterium]